MRVITAFLTRSIFKNTKVSVKAKYRMPFSLENDTVSDKKPAAKVYYPRKAAYRANKSSSRFQPMKKLYLMLFFACLVFPSLAQEFRFGVKGGLNYTDINGKDLDKNAHRSKIGWHAGAMVNIQYPGNTWFSIQPELIYTRKGYENYSLLSDIRDKNNNLLYTRQEGGLVRLNYLELPVMLNFKLGIIIFEAGPQFSFLVGVRDESFLRQTFVNGTETTIPLNHFERAGTSKADVGLSAGLRLQTENGVSLGVRFSQGFVKLPSNTTDRHAPPGFNQVFQVYAAYLWPQ